jgi:hypothetical protein
MAMPYDHAASGSGMRFPGTPRNNHYTNHRMEKAEMTTMLDVMKYLATPEKPVNTAEFSAFWKGLTPAEKEEYKEGIPKD